MSEPSNPNSPKAWLIFGTKLCLWVVWGLTWGVVGIALCATGIGIPLGLAALTLAGWPLAKTLATRNLQKVKWEARWSYVEDGEDNDIPWVI